MRSGGERDSLAPVIPLFGGAGPLRPAPKRVAVDEVAAEQVTTEADEAPSGFAVARGDDSAGLAWHPTWASDRARRETARGIADENANGNGDASEGASSVELAERVLLKKLRTRSLSVSEARGVLRECDLDDGSTEDVLASMTEFGYLDDAALAEQLVHIGVDRKGQGRQLIAQTLAKRGIPRDIIDAALTELADDDLERALEFARGKARSMQSLDRDVALRRLSGQLARRGYGGSLAMTAARIALDERAAGSQGVRFR